MPASSHVLDRIGVTFDDDHAVAEAGLVLPATLLAATYRAAVRATGAPDVRGAG